VVEKSTQKSDGLTKKGPAYDKQKKRPGAGERKGAISSSSRGKESNAPEKRKSKTVDRKGDIVGGEKEERERPMTKGRSWFVRGTAFSKPKIGEKTTKQPRKITREKGKSTRFSIKPKKKKKNLIISTEKESE